MAPSSLRLLHAGTTAATRLSSATRHAAVMSGQTTGYVRGRGTRPLEQLLLYAIADHCDEAGVTWVKKETIAASASCSARAVGVNLKRLEQADLIARVRRHDDRGYRTSDYIIVAPLADDRGAMIDAVDCPRSRLYQDDARVLQLACTPGPDLTAPAAPRRIPAAATAARSQGLTAPHAGPNRTSGQSYPHLTPVLSAPDAPNTLREAFNGSQSETTLDAAGQAADDDQDPVAYVDQWLQIKQALSKQDASVTQTGQTAGIEDVAEASVKQ